MTQCQAIGEGNAGLDIGLLSPATGFRETWPEFLKLLASSSLGVGDMGIGVGD
jgi:hypothetical protein